MTADPILTAYATAREASAKAQRATADAETAIATADAMLVSALSAALPGYRVSPDDDGAIVWSHGGQWGLSVQASVDGFRAYCGYTLQAGPCASVDEIAETVLAYLDITSRSEPTP